MNKLRTNTLKPYHHIYTDLKSWLYQNADLVIEAATENREIKLNLFKQLSELCGDGVILASNTSSISITQIASVTKKRR